MISNLSSLYWQTYNPMKLFYIHRFIDEHEDIIGEADQHHMVIDLRMSVVKLLAITCTMAYWHSYHNVELSWSHQRWFWGGRSSLKKWLCVDVLLTWCASAKQFILNQLWSTKYGTLFCIVTFEMWVNIVLSNFFWMNVILWNIKLL